MRWALTLDPNHGALAADDPPPPAPEGDAPPAGDTSSDAPAGEFHALLVVENTMSGDKRFINEGVLTWRDLPLPLMGLDTETMMHLDSVAIGTITRIERVGTEIHGYGPWATTPEANTIRQHVRSGAVRGVSADLDDLEFELVFPEMELTPADDDGDLTAAAGDHEVPEGDVIPFSDMDPTMVVTTGRVMGATVVPHPAFQECFIEDLNPEYDLTTAVVAAATAPAIPVAPPAEWLADLVGDLALTRYMPLTITDEGEVIGHCADWESCHLSFPDRCVTAPHSQTDYAFFHTGELRLSDGSRVPVGHIAVNGGHAELSLSPAQAQAHYDDTTTCIADVRVGEDQFGIWVHGALRPDAHPNDVRIAMASGISGDWRRIGRGLELIHLSNVNVPGINNGARVRVREQLGLVAAVQAWLPRVEVRDVDLDDAVVASIRDRIAMSIGRGTDSRRAALWARVHPEPVAV